MQDSNNDNDKKIEILLSLADLKKKTKEKTDILNNIEIINGYDLVFILSLIIKNNFSGNLIIVNEENLLSGINFIYGDIVKVDYPDQEHLLGNLIVENEIISKFEMQEIIQKSGGVRLGDYLVDNEFLTEQQLRKLLFKQTTLRLGKYLSSLSIRVKFSFDGESNDSILINKIDYIDILHNWIFNQFEDDWLDDYGNYYQKQSFSSDIGTKELTNLKDYPEVFELAFKFSQFNKKIVSYNDIFKIAHHTRQRFFRLIHFLVLSGHISVYKAKQIEAPPQISTTKKVELVETLDADLKKVQVDLLAKNYFTAFGLLNKYSSFMSTHPTVNFYFIWIKLIGAYYNNHMIDVQKISQDFYNLDYYKINPAEFYYVQALLLAVKRKYKESDEAYSRALYYNIMFKDYPINDSMSFIDRIVNFFSKINNK